MFLYFNVHPKQCLGLSIHPQFLFTLTTISKSIIPCPFTLKKHLVFTLIYSYLQPCLFTLTPTGKHVQITVLLLLSGVLTLKTTFSAICSHWHPLPGMFNYQCSVIAGIQKIQKWLTCSIIHVQLFMLSRMFISTDSGKHGQLSMFNYCCYQECSH